MIKAIIFDIGGVVLNPGNFEPLSRKYAKVMKRKAPEVHKVIDKHWRLWKVESINESEFFDGIAKDLKVGLGKAKLREIMYGLIKPSKGMFTLARKLRRNYKVFSLTNHTREFFVFLDGKFGIENKFDGIFKSYDSRMAKPDTNFFKYMLDKTGMKPGECVFIDDSGENVEAARKLGMTAILHISTKRTEKELRKAGVNF